MSNQVNVVTDKAVTKAWIKHVANVLSGGVKNMDAMNPIRASKPIKQC